VSGETLIHLIRVDNRATGHLRAVQILFGHSKIENTVRYLGIDVEDALALAENTNAENTKI